jgi:hypothetical protein
MIHVFNGHWLLGAKQHGFFSHNVCAFEFVEKKDPFNDYLACLKLSKKQVGIR